MGKSYGSSKPTNDKLLFLRQAQEQTKEGSKDWSYYEDLMNQIIAQNYLHYVNR